MKRVPKVNVIGAGVIGLTTATLLLIEGYDVTIIAKHFPGDMTVDYTSPWAGARWKTLAPKDDARLQRYDADSFKIFWELAKCCADETGIMVVPAFDYYADPTPDQRAPWWKRVVPGFRVLSRKELPPGIDVGYTFTTVAITPDRYLRWLQSQFAALGGKRRHADISSLAEAMDDRLHSVDIVVNCTGMHAPAIQGVNDKHVNRPVRGQNVVVRANHVRKTIAVKTKDEYTYVIPRADGTVILGTTKTEGDRNAEADPAVARDIMERACKRCPELTNGKSIDHLEVVGNIIGLRPKRYGGPRVETEVKESPSGKPILVAHNYGHDGSGYQASWGSAKHIVKLIKEHHETLQAQSSKIRELLSRL